MYFWPCWSLLLHRLFSSPVLRELSLQRFLLLQSRPLGTCASVVVVRRLSSCGPQAELLCGVWDLPVSPALAEGFFPTEPPAKPCTVFLIPHVWHTIWYLSFSFCHFFRFSFAYRWFRVSCWFLLCSKVNQLHIYIYPLSFRFFSHTGSYRILSRVPCATGVGPCPLSILYIVSVCMSIPTSRFICPTFTSVTINFLQLWLYFCFVNQRICSIF